MLLSIPAKLRSALYTIGAFNLFITIPTLGYLADQEVISMFWSGLVGVINGGLFLLAKANVTPEE